MRNTKNIFRNIPAENLPPWMIEYARREEQELTRREEERRQLRIPVIPILPPSRGLHRKPDSTLIDFSIKNDLNKGK
jgi:hypothetical protein